MPEHKFKDELLRENFTYNDRGDVVTNLFGLEYTFNKKYLDDALNGNNQADIACEKADGKSPVCITTHVDGHPVNAILMPKKVKKRRCSQRLNLPMWLGIKPLWLR